MPMYDYECKKCGDVFELEFKIADRKIPTEESCRLSTCDGEVRQMISAPPGFAYDNIGAKKPDASFNDKLKEIKKAHHGSTLNVIE
jgi:putative FmdB family regulatory protein